MSGYEVIRFEGRQYVCEKAWGNSFGDLDCDRYAGGRPSVGLIPDLHCSGSFGSYECTTGDYYPSQLDGLDVITIDGDPALCDGSECYLWDETQSPDDVITGFPDYVCEGRRCRPA